ncbi:MAG: DJ-1/PfpI family protein [Planctomycetes bacterium]|nr:DJ-1/PfpI family protein [Planctomycetota bacterium]
MSQRKSSQITRRRALGVSLGAAGATVLGAATAEAQSKKRPSAKGKRVLVAIGDFSEGMETYYMVYRLIEEGAVPVVAAAKVKRLQMVVHDFDPNYSNYIEMTGYCIQTDVAYKDVDPTEYDAMLLPGGRGAEEIRQYDDALEITGYFLDKKLPLGAMCHGPQVLYAARSLKGRRIAAYSGIKADIELAGGEFVDKPVVVDGALVTSRGWPDLPYFMPKFLEVLAGA